MRILVLAHNHPHFHPGGSEILAHELFREVGGRPEIEAFFLAGTNALQRPPSPGTPFQTVGRSAREMLLWTRHFDVFLLSQTDTHGVLAEFERFVREFQPDVVWAHHTLLLGVETFAVLRRAVPGVRIVLTLHDYYPICHRDGVMVRTAVGGGETQLCDEASPDRCSGCFPHSPRMAFKLRDLYIRRHFALVDRFVAPSRFLKQRYVDWGLPAEKIAVVRNGRALPPPMPHRDAVARAARPAFATFGNVSPMKGTLVAIEAAGLAARRATVPFTLTVHGAPLFQPEDFVRRLTDTVAAVNAIGPAHVRLAGQYRDEEVPQRMAATDWVVVPSVWWENAPLVIDEAFHHRRPVIASGIGGMAEAVTDGINGLHVPPGDPMALADRLLDCLGTEGLWDRLCAGIPEVRGIAACADDYLTLFDDLGPARPTPMGRRGARPMGLEAAR